MAGLTLKHIAGSETPAGIKCAKADQEIATRGSEEEPVE